MKFSIIIPTHKRAASLTRAVESVIKQTYTNWEILVVNDSPDDKGYASFEETFSDPRITYLKNDKNKGVNFSRNRALDSISKDSEWIIFLDDDDYLETDALGMFLKLINTHISQKWFVTNRALTNGKSTTKFPKSDTEYSYAWDYLISKRCKGDATHCIKTTLVDGIRFSKLIKQAEEWLFFYQVGLKSKIFYHSHNSTLSDGYNETSGLNFRRQTRGSQLKAFFLIINEGFNLHLLYHLSFLTYLSMRLVKLLLKP